jgi:hypothetical protein
MLSTILELHLHVPPFLSYIYPLPSAPIYRSSLTHRRKGIYNQDGLRKHFQSLALRHRGGEPTSFRPR